jgi:ribosomal protein S12 methylthiotransferase
MMKASERTFHIVTLGCEKNLVETERLAGLLETVNWKWTEPSRAQVVLVNTCGFIEEAREESLAEVARWLDRAKKVVAYGCMVRIAEDRIRRQFNGRLDSVYGTLDEVAEAVAGVPLVFEPPRRLLTPKWYGYLKISEGCSQPCSFCVIPKIKGRQRSFPEDLLLAEAQSLAERGAREINIVAQDSTLYGTDRNETQGNGLTALLASFSDEVRAAWLRVFYLYPTGLTDALIDVFHRGRLLPYFDIPIQHSHPETLKRMGRKGKPDQYRDLFARLRKEFPECYIRSSFIVGFPGETNEEFDALLRWVNEVPMDGLSVFAYSRETQTPSGRAPNQIPEALKRERRFALTREFNSALEKRNLERVGKKCSVLIESVNGGRCSGRAWFQAAGIDGITTMETAMGVAPGDLLEVEITGTSGGDFWAAL